LNSFLQFWGKAQPANETTHAWHPAALHGLDVAAVAAVLLTRAPAFAAAMARLCGWTADDFSRFVVFLIALHDIGKFSRPFQAKAPAHWPFAPPVLALSGPRHDEVGLYLLLCEDHALDALEAVTPGWDEHSRHAMARAVAGHHGRPVEKPFKTLSSKVVCARSGEAAVSFAKAVVALLAPPALPPPQSGTAEILSWWLAGLTTLCDWIGSAQAWFPYMGDSIATLPDYWPHALRQAEVAVAESGIAPVAIGASAGLAGLMPHIPPLTPTPMQALAEHIPLPPGPICVILEDATGGGKTEAALVLAQRLMAGGRADGLFIGLPTMATADAMYGRLDTAYRRLFAAEARPSLALAHGRARLNDLFQGAILAKAGSETGVSEGEDDADATASAHCAAWLATEGRRVFLAHVGVGTIDQALLAVLPARHAALRLFGLCRKVLIVDEAHSYDAYMAEELQRLLTFHAALGGSSIVLSATLAGQRRADLLRAFASGLKAAPFVPKDTAYPLMTVAAGDGAAEYHEPMRAALARDLPARRLGSAEAAVMALAEASRAGACGIWVRNTVDDARSGAAALAAEGVTPILFHARFAMGDRLRIQAEVLRLFGRNSTGAERAPGGVGRVLVATQVVEQSLDLDADVMVSDLAPIELLIQRAGRLHRHPDRRDRAAAHGVPELLVVSPEPVAAPDEAWAADAAIGGSRFVYPPHILWLSATVLFGAGRIATPDGVRPLVEAVYSLDAENAVPKGLAREAERAEGKTLSQVGHARTNLLVLTAGYCSDSGFGGKWETDARVPTRLGDDYVTFRMAREVGGRLMPWIGSETDAEKAWALSEIALRRSLATSDAGPTAALLRLRAGWRLWEREMPVLILRPDAAGACVAEAIHDKAPVHLGYDPARGLWRF
jgi:CRISPR-associated endonuclease/helicase Cas3